MAEYEGKSREELIDKGNFVSDEIINDLIGKVLSDSKYSNRVIFDGYPRNIQQGEIFNKMLNKYKQKIGDGPNCFDRSSERELFFFNLR